MKIGVSIVSYNTKDYLKKILEKFSGVSNDYEVWVLDNNSEDGSYEMVKKNYPKINLLKSEKNLGFAKGQNMILKKINSEIILVLNPDTEFELTTLKEMIEFLQNKNKCGILSCKIVDFSNNIKSNGGDLPFGISLMSWLFNLEIFGIKKNFHRSDKEYFTSPHKVGWVGGTFMLIKREVLEKVGFFNEEYFMYFEDVDLCIKAEKLGYDIFIYPQVSIKHHSGASSKNPRFNQWLGEYKGLINYYQKEFGELGKHLIKFLIYCSSILRIIAFFIIGKINISNTYVKVIKSI